MVTSSSGINVLLHENVFFEIGFHFAKFYFYLQAKYQELLAVLPTCCQKLELRSQPGLFTFVLKCYPDK